MGRRKADAIAVASGKKKLKPAGRPNGYTEKLANRICELIATHPIGYEKLRIMYPDLPDKTAMYTWRLQFPEFSAKYLEARRKQSEIQLEEIDDMIPSSITTYVDEKGNERIDAPSASLAIARANNRKWMASRLLPKVYGDKIELERKESENEYLKEQIAELRAELDKKNKKDY